MWPGVGGQPVVSNTIDNYNYVTYYNYQNPNYTSYTFPTTSTTWTSGSTVTLGPGNTYVTMGPQVVHWGGKVYLNPSAKLRVLMDAIRLL